MPDPKEIIIRQVEAELRICPDCGYERGFHVSFVNTAAAKDNPVKSTRDLFRVILICPECGARYDVGWRVSFNEFENRFMKSPTCVPHGNPAECLPEASRHDRPE